MIQIPPKYIELVLWEKKLFNKSILCSFPCEFVFHLVSPDSQVFRLFTFRFTIRSVLRFLLFVLQFYTWHNSDIIIKYVFSMPNTLNAQTIFQSISMVFVHFPISFPLLLTLSAKCWRVRLNLKLRLLMDDFTFYLEMNNER